MSWNLPPGVYGGEPEISGAPERDVEVDCPDCPFSGTEIATLYGGDWFWTCPECDTEHSIPEEGI